MGERVSVALLVTTYNWPEALKLVLDSVLVQTVLPDEVIIADDGSGEATRDVVEAFRRKTNIPVKHFWHPDEGFRKTIIINQAITGTSSDYIIQIDGDIVMHELFIRDHITEAEKGYFIRGSRVLLQEEITRKYLNNGQFERVSSFSKNVRNRINSLRIPFLAPLLIKKSQRSRNWIGCNCAFWRADFLKVNGYNNELKGWGHEDIELAARFINSGLYQKKVKLKAVCYHLHHPFNSRVHENINYRVYLDTLNHGIAYCSNGYRHHLTTE
ncbi:Glycosyltransferase involved in cell wall bisynthesis [Chitinophaga ginsengisegetis]|jgi:glycosyltransferase involved in cell wall biosynthesis|uniref:Glycosyltransferase involved in cell wall bisynthesis n=1 Tax=Chitinophaga ginsengisegetis TaxID=393003 RepID=A0A1T5N7X9_9BACT|nr:glycosyltransferase family 2 protein [Chitinophaga ginsengisegetis]SKC96556.1 Glycosyltransferase involved in cell wall bisynthesis [Chitinophaga ginsengisegetis]